MMIFINCANPVDSPLYVETGTCLNGEKSSNVSLLMRSYVNVGGMKASDLMELCSLERMTLLPDKDYKNMSFKEIHSQLAYGFELSWHNSMCGSCVGICYIDDSYHGKCKAVLLYVSVFIVDYKQNQNAYYVLQKTSNKMDGSNALVALPAQRHVVFTTTCRSSRLWHQKSRVFGEPNQQTQGPYFAFSWLSDNNTFQAGDVATIKIKVLGEFDRSKGNAFSPKITVNGKMGNSCFVSGVLLDVAGEDTDTWRILFTPIRVGVFNVFIEDGPFHVFDSSLHFEVKAGKIYASACIASWRDLENEFEAGAKATVLIVPRDAFGNNVTSTGQELRPFNFTVSELYENGSIANVPDITHIGWNEFGQIILEFIATKSGNLLLHVEGGNQALNGCPLLYKVNPGPVDVSNCEATWKFETNVWQIFSKMETCIHQKDKYGNPVLGFYEFDTNVFEEEMNLSIPLADMSFTEVMPGIQLCSFSLLEPGNFLLTISDTKHNRSISNMPFSFNVFIESIRVQIIRETDSYSVKPSINPIVNGNVSTPRAGNNSIRQAEIALAPSEIAPVSSVDLGKNSTGNSKVLASAFNVIYTPEKSGIYEIYVFCGNVLLNSGHSFRKEVRAGEVNVSLSTIQKFSLRAPKMIENEMAVQLVDSFFNPVLSQQSRLTLEIASVNKSGFSSGMFVDNDNGTYCIRYAVKDVGAYEMCVSFDGKRLSPCPLGVNMYGVEYFPKANDDNISVWEDESIAFDVLANDYFAGNNASIVELSKPDRGSLLQNGNLFRYTPYKDYYGNDSFTYTLSDVNGNLASASAIISVLNIPPHGFSAIVIKHSDPTEKICVTLSARSGTVFLSPVLMQFWQPIWGEFSAKKGDDAAKDLILEGSVEAINLALQSIQYLGITIFSPYNFSFKNVFYESYVIDNLFFLTLIRSENFYGDDAIHVSASNKNGKNDLDVPVSVEPVNDPPFIKIPKFIILKSNESGFIVTFSVEVDKGFLVTNLAAELLKTTELKVMSSYQWQPIQTYVSISRHFMVRANGVRFRGALNECNSVMQQLSYDGRESDAILTVKLNDMGHYGCSSDCTDKIAVPLYSEATVQLIRRRSMSSLLAHTLGSAILVEFLMVFSLGGILLFFTCKCAMHLANERRRRISVTNSQLSSVQNSQKKSQNTDFSEDTTNFTCCCSSPFLLSGQTSNFRQRSNRRLGVEETGKNISSPPGSSSSRHLQTPPGLTPLVIEKDQKETF
ncbi:protein GAMETE EXPRESSED 2-like [Populus alba x Populus x berolinensis]|uniref:Protein GAMETE EXPRESSED 2-like n=1 Tax=Populus alba x Populus x berolinensis TaxID=444605 RepID=A0AAD6QJ45_9ROSI|nr:protein GAMETE EXPRESSED 2-like [Populus alba x Populus x berolinensis]